MLDYEKIDEAYEAAQLKLEEEMADREMLEEEEDWYITDDHMEE